MKVSSVGDTLSDVTLVSGEDRLIVSLVRAWTRLDAANGKGTDSSVCPLK